MYSTKIPILHERIRLVKENQENNLQQVLWAREREEQYGDLVRLCELWTDRFEYVHSRLLEQYTAAIDLAVRGFLAFDVVVSIDHQWIEVIMEELGNRDLQATLVALEEHYDLLKTGYSMLADHLDQLLASLTAQRDDIIRKGRENASLSTSSDVNLDQTD